MSQKMSYLHKSFLQKCRIKFHKVMVPGCRLGPQKGRTVSHVFMWDKSSQGTLSQNSIHMEASRPARVRKSETSKISSELVKIQGN
jgi:hypothetical protein